VGSPAWDKGVQLFDSEIEKGLETAWISSDSNLTMSSPPGARPAVLIIDDEPLLVECFVENFADCGVELIGLSDPQRAQELARERTFAAAFFDYRMPKISGLELSRSFPPATRKFLITGELGLETPPGFEAVIGKPYSFQQIEKILRSLAAA
jgi:DNA-binding NtrC family response regulator